MRLFVTNSVQAIIALGVFSLFLSLGCSKSPAPTEKKKSALKSTQQKRTNQTGHPQQKDVTEKKSRMPKFFEDGKPAEKPAPKVQQVYRRSDDRPKHDVAKLKKYGIQRHESQRLLLYTDIDPKIAKTLPPIIDAAYIEWEKYFGKLLPDREKTEFQITGYLMKDKELFKRLGLQPANLRPFLNGRHRGAEFWMYEQQYDYYRRHLLIHEATHCFMTITPDVNASVWYMEGMAELFGTHRITKEGKIQFRIMPNSREEVAGLGRITIIKEDIAAGSGLLLSGVTNFKPNDYMKTNAYAWSWGLCKFFDSHPKYQERFQELGRYTTNSQFPRMFKKNFEADLTEILPEWRLFAVNLQYGYQCKPSAINFQSGRPLPKKKNHQCTIEANQGWQSSQLLVEKGKTYDLTTSGRFTLAQHPKPWVSEAAGISFQYFKGKPIGRLLATLHVSDAAKSEKESFSEVISIGLQKKWKATQTGTLYLRLNDSWTQIADNEGSVNVSIRLAKPNLDEPEPY